LRIESIAVSNFKSFSESEIELGQFNVLVGANASGKSNFVQIFKFLRDTVEYDLENAISMQGGAEYFRNIKIGKEAEFSVRIRVSIERGREVGPYPMEIIGGKYVASSPYRFDYQLGIRFHKRGRGFTVSHEKLTADIRLLEYERRRTKSEGRGEEVIGEGSIMVENKNGVVAFTQSFPEELGISPRDIFPFSSSYRIKIGSKSCLLQYPFLSYLLPTDLNRSLSQIAVYDFDPRFPKTAVPVTGKNKLEEDGRNLAIVLREIISNKEKLRRFSNLLADVLPFVEKVGLQTVAGKSLFFKLQEKYVREYLPSCLISDGTINVTALVVALYFEDRPFMVIEEPERNVHPFLISKIVDMLKDASKNRQIIVTTHNPEIVKHAGLENLLLIYRDKEGFSKVSRPLDNNTVKVFLKNELGIEDLYVQNLLEPLP